MRLALFALSTLCLFGQNALAPWKGPAVAFADLPAAASWSGGEITVTNSASCTSATGSGPVKCRSNGTTWALISGGGTSYSEGAGLLLTGTIFSVDFNVVPGLNAANTYTAANDFSAATMRITTGSGVPSSGNCNSSGHVGKVYVRNDVTTAPFYSCGQTASMTYGWVLAGGGSAPPVVEQIVLAHYIPGQGVVGTEAISYYDAGVEFVNVGTPPNAMPWMDNSGTDVFWTRGVIPSTNWGGTVKLRGRATTDQGGTGTFQLSVTSGCDSSGSSTTTTMSSAQTVTPTITNNQWVFWELTLTPAGSCAAGNVLQVSVTRTATGTYTSKLGIPDLALEF